MADLEPGSEGKRAADELVMVEKEMASLKSDFSQFQTEFMDLKRKFEKAVERLDGDTKRVSIF